MKKRAWKLLAYQCMLCLLLSTLLVGLDGVARADEPVVPTPPDPPVMEAKQTAPFSRITEGPLNDTAIFVKAGPNASEVTTTGVKPLGLNAMGVQMDTETAVRETWDEAFTVNYMMEAQSAQLIAGFSGALLYFKLPDTGGETNEIWFQANDAVNGKYMQLKTNTPVYTLANGEKIWVTIPQVTSRGGYRVLTLPDGFDGYIYLPLDAFDASATEAPFTELTKIQFNIRNFGGPGGSAIVGPFLLTSNALRTKDQVWLNAEADGDNKAVVRNLFTGEVDPPVMEAKQTAPFSRITEGPLNDTTIFVKAGGKASEVTTTGVKPLGLNAMGVQMDTEAAVRETWDEAFTVNYMMEAQSAQPIAGFSGALLYFKLPDTDSETNEIWFQANDAVNGKYMQLKANTPVYTLANGEKTWVTIPQVTSRGGYRVLTLPDGFDGYIYLPLDAFDTSATEAPFTELTKIQFNIRNFGGPGGSAIVGPFLLTSNALRTKDRVWLNEEVDGDNKAVVRNLFTGEVEVPVMEAKQTEPFSRITEGPLNDTAIFVKAGGKASEVTTTGVKPLGLNAMGVQMDTETAVRETWDEAFTVNYMMEAQSAQPIAGFSGALLYFKLPDTDSETNEIWFQANDAVNGKYMQLKTNTPVYTLANGEKTWVTIPQVTSRGGYRVLTLPDGFDGYIYLPLDAFDTSGNSNPFTALTKIQFNIRNFGGPGGSAIVGPFLLTSNALRTKDQVWLNEEVDGDNKAVVRNLFTGKTAYIEACEDAFDTVRQVLLKQLELSAAETAEIKSLAGGAGDEINILDLLSLEKVILDFRGP